MRFADSDVRPNRQVEWDEVRVGNTSDARWRGVVVLMGAMLKSPVVISSAWARRRA